MVEWKQMWEVTTWDKKFSGVEKYMQPKVIKYYYYLANDLVNLEKPNGDVRILYTTNKEAYAISNEVEGNISEGEVVTIPWGGNVNIQYYKGKFVTADNRIATSNNIDYLSNKFLYYWMLSQKEEIAKMYRGAGIQHPSMLSVLTMSIPIPSLEEQTRIVGILDTFTSAIDNLKEQIAQRRKQYEYYRDQLLDLEGKPGVEMKKLGEIATLQKTKNKQHLTENAYSITQAGLVPTKSFFKEKTNVTSSDTSGYYIVEKDWFVYSPSRIDVGSINYLKDEGPVIVSPIDVVFSVDSNICIPAYLLEYFFTYKGKKDLLKNREGVEGMGRRNLPFDAIKGVQIPLPPLSEQQRIVSILDTFEASIQNLEAQLKERQKQYEYYRNKLLTFE